MKLRFRTQAYQLRAVEAVADCFAGQPPGRPGQTGNAPLALGPGRLLANVRAVQAREGLPLSDDLGAVWQADGRGGWHPRPAPDRPGPLQLDIEMETGTGKTYVATRTIFELNRRHGWSKFVVLVPSVAIREGIARSLELTAEHFAESFGRRARVFVYDSRRLHEIDAFATEPGIAVMILNIQAFAARTRANRRIWEELDAFGSRRPIDLIAAARPVLILDEPQKMEGPATAAALPAFDPLFVLRTSATHRTRHCLIHRLDAAQAFAARLVKRIAVRGIEHRGRAPGWLYLEGIETSARAPVARIGLDLRGPGGGVRRRVLRVGQGEDLQARSGLDAYRGLTVTQIDAVRGRVEFANGTSLEAGEVLGEGSEADLRRLQIRETIRAHLERERRLFARGVKVLSLFFIDAVARYRDPAQPGARGDYARTFEAEYARLVDEILADPDAGDDAGWRDWLAGISAADTHRGYFSVDRPGQRARAGAASEDAGAYALILKDKERLLSFEEPTRFLFSHSALREGWDNPNIFTLCMLRQSESTLSRRQEVGRGLRLAVDQSGARVDAASEVHEVNVLTVVAGESFAAFAGALQGEIAQSLGGPAHAADRLPRIEDGRRPARAAPPVPAPAVPARIDLDTDALIAACVRTLDARLRVVGPQFAIRSGEQGADGRLCPGGPAAQEAARIDAKTDLAQSLPVDPVGRVADDTGLTRATVAAILGRIEPGVFAMLTGDAEAFVAGAAGLIGAELAERVIPRKS